MSRAKPIIVIGVLLAGLYVASQVSPWRSTGPAAPQRAAERTTQPPRPQETFRLVHAQGNEETEAERGLSRAECERRRDELKMVATQLGTYNEALGLGSITCLPESAFAP